MGSLGRKTQGKTREACSSFSLLAPSVWTVATFQLFSPGPSPEVGIVCGFFCGRGLSVPFRCLLLEIASFKLLLSSLHNEVCDSFPRLVTLLMLSEL